jgi:general secretion pathway protein G
MERSTVTGKKRTRHGDSVTRRCGENVFRRAPILSRILSPYRSKGFTLLELMIVISIIIILAAIALPQYRRTILAAREAVLRDDLYKMRSLLDQYAADKGKLPADLSDLVNERYMRELPVDPFTGKAEWNPVPGEDPAGGEQGIVDVRSLSTDTSSEGTLYSEW